MRFLAFGGMKFSIPAQSKLDLTCDLKIPTGTPDLHVFSGMPHMHKLGTAIRATLLPASGPVVDLGTREPWDFDTQYWSNNTATLKAGDTVRALQRERTLLLNQMGLLESRLAEVSGIARQASSRLTKLQSQQQQALAAQDAALGQTTTSARPQSASNLRSSTRRGGGGGGGGAGDETFEAAVRE